MKKWTPNEIDILKNNYDLPFDELISKTGHPINSIKYKLWELNLSRDYYWNKHDEKFLIDNCDKLMVKEIAEKLKKSFGSVKKKAYSLGLKKPKNFKYRKDLSKILNLWSDNDTEYLIKNYSNMTNIELSINLNKTISSVMNKANNLKLKKDPSIKSEFTKKRNKEMGRDLTQDLLKEIALRYKTLSDFQKYDVSAYQTARRSGILKDICSHMFVGNYSTPQLILHQIVKQLIDPDCRYNERKIIKPLEIDIYSDKYRLGFEYNGKGWHGEEKESFDRDKIKVDMCREKGIMLIVIIENNRLYEKDIKEQLIDNLDLINRITNLNLNKENIINCSIDYNKLFMDKRDIKAICLSYDNFQKFKSENPQIYQKLNKNKLIYEYTKHMKRKHYSYWDEESLKKEIDKYEYLGDFIKNSKGSYVYCQKHGLEHLFSHLKRKKNVSYTDEDISKVVKNYKYLYDFKKDHPKLYKSVKNSKRWYLLEYLKKLRNYKNNESIILFSEYQKFMNF